MCVCVCVCVCEVNVFLSGTEPLIGTNTKCLPTIILETDQLCQQRRVPLEGCILLIELQLIDNHQEVLCLMSNGVRVQISLYLFGLPLAHKVVSINLCLLPLIVLSSLTSLNHI